MVAQAETAEQAHQTMVLLEVLVLELAQAQVAQAVLLTPECFQAAAAVAVAVPVVAVAVAAVLKPLHLPKAVLAEAA
jgi:hypothetical protein